MRRSLDSLIDDAVSRLSRHCQRDEEFTRRFGKWRRPDFARRYPLESLSARLVRWDPRGDGVIDVAPFLRALSPDDRRIAGEIARFVAEIYEGAYASDRTLEKFRLDLVRRLDECGF